MKLLELLIRLFGRRPTPPPPPNPGPVDVTVTRRTPPTLATMRWTATASSRVARDGQLDPTTFSAGSHERDFSPVPTDVPVSFWVESAGKRVTVTLPPVPPVDPPPPDPEPEGFRTIRVDVGGDGE